MRRSRRAIYSHPSVLPRWLAYQAQGRKETVSLRSSCISSPLLANADTTPFLESSSVVDMTTQMVHKVSLSLSKVRRLCSRRTHAGAHQSTLQYHTTHLSPHSSTFPLQIASASSGSSDQSLNSLAIASLPPWRVRTESRLWASQTMAVCTSSLLCVRTDMPLLTVHGRVRSNDA
jgi:hypothetical protein